MGVGEEALPPALDELPLAGEDYDGVLTPAEYEDPVLGVDGDAGDLRVDPALGESTPALYDLVLQTLP